MLPPAPPRLSITTGWPSAAEIRSATRRPTMSALPPAANGTIIRIGRSGNAAKAERGSNVAAEPNPIPAISARREIGKISGMGLPPLLIVLALVRRIRILEKTGAPETIRTSDLCLRRATLYPAELRAPWSFNRRIGLMQQRA